MNSTFPSATAHASIVAAVLDDAESRCSLADFLRRHELDRAALTDVDARVPLTLVAALWSEIPVLVGDDDYGLHYGTRTPTGSYYLLEYICSASRTIGDMIANGVRYFEFLSPLTSFELIPTPLGVQLVQRVPPYARSLRHAWEAGFALILSRACSLSRSVIRPLEVAFVHPAPSNPAASTAVFGPEVQYNAPANRLAFAASDLDRPLSTADAKLETFVRRQLESFLATAATPSCASSVATHLPSLLLSGTVTLAAAARKVAMSERTLQRRLADEGTTFDAILDQTRQQMADQLLPDPKLSIAEIAFLLGFQSPTGFGRAFRRWHGVAPTAFRSRV